MCEITYTVTNQRWDIYMIEAQPRNDIYIIRITSEPQYLLLMRTWLSCRFDYDNPPPVVIM